MMGINAVKGVEIGAGFESVAQKGTEHGDEMTPQGFVGNNAGGVLGGISTGQDITVSIAIKPTSSIRLPRRSIERTASVMVETFGRHDPCVGIRATPIAEAMLALVLMDHALRHRAQCGDVRVDTPKRSDRPAPRRWRGPGLPSVGAPLDGAHHQRAHIVEQAELGLAQERPPDSGVPVAIDEAGRLAVAHSGMTTKQGVLGQRALPPSGNLAANFGSRAFSMKITRSLASAAWNTLARRRRRTAVPAAVPGVVAEPRLGDVVARAGCARRRTRARTDKLVDRFQRQRHHLAGGGVGSASRMSATPP